MKFKKSLFLFSPALILFGSISLLSKSITNDSLNQTIVNESSSAIEFVDEMNDIYLSSTLDYDGEVVDYYASTKQYELQNDVDFAGVENLYDGTMDVSLINGSSFNGNGYSIQNRWDSDQFEAYFNNASNLRGVTYMNDFDEIYSGVHIPIYLFNPFTDVDIYNLTFDNSPFAFAGSASSSFVNVNMTNIDIEDVDLVFNWSGSTYYPTDINSFNMALFMYQTDMDLVWENSYVNNVTIANNTFDFSNVISDPGEAGGFPYGVDVKIGLIGKAKAASVTSNMILKNLEFSNWNISNNQIMVKTYTQGSYINDPSLKITPFIMDAGKVTITETPIEGHYSDLSEQNMSPKAEDSIYVSEIYFHNWTINDNYFIDTTSSQEYGSVNFSMGPNIIDDSVSNMSFSSIYLDNIQSNQDFINDEYYSNFDTNTTISFSENYIFDSSQLIENSLGETFTPSEENLLDNPSYTETIFDPQFWNTQSEDLTLKNSSSLGFDSNVNYDWTTGTPKPYFSLDLEPNNFWVEQLDINLLDQDQNVIYSTSIQNSDDPITWDGSNQNFKLDLSLFSSVVFSSLETYTLNVDFSQYNDSYQYSFTLNASNDYLIYNFQNTYDNGILNYSFNYIDPYNEITSFDLSLYNKNKLVFKDSFLPTSTTTYSSIPSGISGLEEVSISDPSNYYFIFEVNTLNSQGASTTTLLPQEASNTSSFVLGTNVYINDFQTSPNAWLKYYWWVILLIVFAILILLAIFLFIYLRSRSRKNNDSERTGIREYEDSYYDYNDSEYDGVYEGYDYQQEYGYDESQYYDYSQEYYDNSEYQYSENENDLEEYDDTSYDDSNLNQSYDSYADSSYNQSYDRYDNSSYNPTYDKFDSSTSVQSSKKVDYSAITNSAKKVDQSTAAYVAKKVDYSAITNTAKKVEQPTTAYAAKQVEQPTTAYAAKKVDYSAITNAAKQVDQPTTTNIKPNDLNLQKPNVKINDSNPKKIFEKTEMSNYDKSYDSNLKQSDSKSSDSDPDPDQSYEGLYDDYLDEEY